MISRPLRKNIYKFFYFMGEEENIDIETKKKLSHYGRSATNPYN